METKMKKSLSILLSIALAIGAFAENYAVLITGCEPNLPPVTPEYDQFWNDTYLMWESLWQFGWKDENIFVLFGNGADWDTTNQRYSPRLQNQSDPRFPIVITDDSAYYDDVVETFDYLEQTMTNSDFLFIWTFDHGRISSLGDTILCLMGGDSIPDYEFADMLNDIPFNKRVIWMAQCNSGGFLDNLSNNNTVFMSACKALESSFQADNNYPDGGDSLENDYFAPQDYYHHSEFDYHVFNALRLETIVEYHPLTEPDTNDDGNASLPEIYDWEIHHNSLYA
jgi:hypothetical protein